MSPRAVIFRTSAVLLLLAACSAPTRVPEDPCDGVTCSGHGSCAASGESAACTCEGGFHAAGTECVANASPCDGVTCSGHGTCAVGDDSVSCTCESGFHAQGTACVADADPCAGVTCSNHGTCSVSGSSATCTCESGFHAQGTACVADADPCAGVTCSNHGTCSVSGSSATCTCDAGFHASGTSCVADADPCAGVTCSGHGRCQVSASSAACVCDAGFHAEALACVADADPCAGVTCSGHGSCRVSGGAAICVCAPGYFAQGLACELEDPCANVTCLDYEQCVTGACALRPGRCATTADCASPKTCDSQHTCVEPLNPCANVTCSGHGTCDATSGTATCHCDAGYAANGLTCASTASPCDGVTCSGHGSCAVSGTSAVCVCDSGYLASGLSCVASPCNGVTCSGHGSCAVVSGAAQCTCASGYHADGLNCVADATACTGVTCSGHGTCAVVSGAASCSCDAGYDASGTTCVQHVGAGDLVLSELMPDPSTTTDTLGEWIEFYNPTDHAISLADLSIRVGTTSTAVTSAASASVPSHGHFVVARSVDAKVPYGATATFSNLANSGGTAAILIRSTVIDSVTYPAASAGKAFQLSLPAYASTAHADFANWCLAKTAVSSTNTDLGTPGASNADCGAVTDPCTGVSCNHGHCVASGTSASCSCDTGWSGGACDACASGYHLDNGACVANVAPTGLVISEYLASPKALSDTAGEWIELRNAGTTAISLDTLEITVDATSYPIGQTGRTIAAGGYFVLARSTVAPLPSVGAIMSFSLPSSGTHTLGMKLNGVAVGSALTISAPSGAAWQLDSTGTWCAARTPIGAGNADLGTPGAANVGCTQWCVDADHDGHARIDATLCPSGNDACDGDSAHYTAADCAVCTEGQVRPGTQPCGINFEGVYQERCTGGRWAPSAVCTGTAVCIEGQTRTVACGAAPLATRTDTCTNGAWTQGACSADECGTNIRTGDVSIKTVSDIAALSGVTGIDGTLLIEQSDRINLSGLSSLRCVKALTIRSNQNLQAVTGLDNLVRITGAATISYNYALQSLSGLAGLRSAGSIVLDNDNNLRDTNLAALAWVDGDFRITNQYNLTTIAGLRAIRGVAGTFEVATNRVLADVATSGILRSVGGLKITSNPEIRSLTGLQGLAVVLGDMTVSNNLNVYFEITSGLNISLVKGSLALSGNSSMDTILHGFDPLQQIGGNLTIDVNTGCRHFAGFGGLRAIGGSLSISNNVIYDVEPLFPVLAAIDGDAKFTTLGFIGTGVGMPALVRVGGSVVADNATEDVWEPLTSLRVVGGDFVIKNGYKLEFLRLPALQKVLGNFRVQSSGSMALYSYNDMFTGVSALDEVGGSFEVSNIESTRSLTGLEKLAKVGGTLQITSNRYLTTISGLSGIRVVNGDLRIGSNGPLTTIRPLYGITHLGGNLNLSEAIAACDAIGLKDHLILDTGWTGTANITGTLSGGTCP